MKIDRRITNGLAWAGVVLVVGVPAADLLSAQFFGADRATPAQVAVVAPVAPTPAPAAQRPDVAAAKPAEPTKPATQTAAVVDSFLQSGKALPSYITGGDSKPAQAAVAPARPTITTNTAPTQTATAPTTVNPQRPQIVTQPVDPVQVSSIAPQRQAPMPMPLSMRPKPVSVATVTTTSVPPTRAPIATVPPLGNEQVVIPPEVSRPPATVTSADLEDWESGPLSEFLAQRNGQASVAPQQDGFWLDEVQPQGDRVVGYQPRAIWFP